LSSVIGVSFAATAAFGRAGTPGQLFFYSTDAGGAEKRKPFESNRKRAPTLVLETAGTPVDNYNVF
jgi:hypothetical protein